MNMTGTARATVSAISLVLIGYISYQYTMYILAIAVTDLPDSMAVIGLMWAVFIIYLLAACATCLLVNIYKPLHRGKDGLIWGLFDGFCRGLLIGLALSVILFGLAVIVSVHPVDDYFVLVAICLISGLGTGLLIGFFMGLVSGLLSEILRWRNKNATP